MKQEFSSITRTVRVPLWVADYFDKKQKSFGRVIIESCQDALNNELPNLLRELKDAREHVLQLEGNVLQAQNQCNTEFEICGTIYNEYLKQGRDPSFTTHQDRFWIKCKLDDNKIQSMSLESFIMYYTKEKNNGR